MLRYMDYLAQARSSLKTGDAIQQGAFGANGQFVAPGGTAHTQNQLIGVKGEFTFGCYTDLPMDLGVYEKGDDGVDLVLSNGQTIDVKGVSQEYYRLTLNPDKKNPGNVKDCEVDFLVLTWVTSIGIHIMGMVDRERFMSLAKVTDLGHGACRVLSNDDLRAPDYYLGKPKVQRHWAIRAAALEEFELLNPINQPPFVHQSATFI